MRAQRSYQSIEEFQREEIRPSHKAGFSLEDLMDEASFQAEQEFSFENNNEELDFG